MRVGLHLHLFEPVVFSVLAWDCYHHADHLDTDYFDADTDRRGREAQVAWNQLVSRRVWPGQVSRSVGQGFLFPRQYGHKCE